MLREEHNKLVTNAEASPADTNPWAMMKRSRTYVHSTTIHRHSHHLLNHGFGVF